jgi:hypothetical protein
MSSACILLGALNILYQLLETWDRFDPNYLGAYLAGTILRPALLVLAGIMLHLLSGKLARRMAAGFSKS